MTLYHGSKSGIVGPISPSSRSTCDFGRAFYMGGHAVPEEKTRARHARSLELLPSAFPFLSRAFFFDNSTDEMRYLASWDADAGMCVQQVTLPNWFETMRKGLNQ